MKKISKKFALLFGIALLASSAFAQTPPLEKARVQTITPLTLEKFVAFKNAVKLQEEEQKKKSQTPRNYIEVKASEQIKQLRVNE
jgi:hypothetical protein